MRCNKESTGENAFLYFRARPSNITRGNQVPKFRKKPVVIEAVQFTQNMADRKEPWPNGVEECGQFLGDEEGYRHYPSISTLEGRMEVSVNDWIITGIKGEKYPCKPDIFEATYEPVEETTPTPHPSDASVK